MRAALHYLTDDTKGMERQLQTLQELAPHSSRAYSLLAEMAARTRRYRDAVNFALVGLTLDDTNWEAMAALGINRLRLGEMQSGRRRSDKRIAPPCRRRQRDFGIRLGRKP